MSEAKKLTITDFKCMICQEIVVFDVNDPESYNSSTILEEFFSIS